jgi:hypothetical protein
MYNGVCGARTLLRCHQRKSLETLITEGTATPLQLLQAALTHHKEKGSSFKAITNYFLTTNLNNGIDTGSDTADTKQYRITCDTFTAGLHKIGLTTLSNAQTTDLFVSLAHENKDSISIKEFADMCLAIPSTTWKAERARRIRAIADATGTTASTTSTTTSSHETDDAIIESMILELQVRLLLLLLN